MGIEFDDYLRFIEQALDGMLAIAEELGDDLINRRPDMAETNSPYGILNHAVGVTRYWFGALLAGRPIVRDGEAEFGSQGTVADLRQAVEDVKRQVRADIQQVEADQPLAYPEYFMPNHLQRGFQHWKQGAGLMQVYKELAQHHGHMELTRDILRSA